MSPVEDGSLLEDASLHDVLPMDVLCLKPRELRRGHDPDDFPPGTRGVDDDDVGQRGGRHGVYIMIYVLQFWPSRLSGSTVLPHIFLPACVSAAVSPILFFYPSSTEKS